MKESYELVLELSEAVLEAGGQLDRVGGEVLVRQLFWVRREYLRTGSAAASRYLPRKARPLRTVLKPSNRNYIDDPLVLISYWSICGYY